MLKRTMLCAFVVSVMVSNVIAGKMPVAIYEFKNEANAPSEYFKTLRSRIQGNIVNTRKFEVLERQRLETVMKERSLVESGLTKGNADPEGGHLKAAGYAIYGSVLSLGLDSSTISGPVSSQKQVAKVELQLRITNAETGKTVAIKTIVATSSQVRRAGGGQSVSGNAQEQAMTDAIRLAAKKVTAALMDLAFPCKILKVKTNSIMINQTKEQTEIGAIYEVFAVGEDVKDPDTGESLGADEEYMGDVKVSRVSQKFSYAKPVGDLDIEELEVGMILRRQDEETVRRKKREEKDNKAKQFESRF